MPVGITVSYCPAGARKTEGRGKRQGSNNYSKSRFNFLFTSALSQAWHKLSGYKKRNVHWLIPQIPLCLCCRHGKLTPRNALGIAMPVGITVS